MFNFLWCVRSAIYIHETLNEQQIHSLLVARWKRSIPCKMGRCSIFFLCCVRSAIYIHETLNEQQIHSLLVARWKRSIPCKMGRWAIFVACEKCSLHA